MENLLHQSEAKLKVFLPTVLSSITQPGSHDTIGLVTSWSVQNMRTRIVDVKGSMSLKDVVSLLEKDTQIILTENDQPVARILPAAPLPETPIGQRVAGLFPGVWISDDFDDPLPDEFWLGEDA